MQTNFEYNGGRPTMVLGSDNTDEEFEALKSPCLTDISNPPPGQVLRKRLQAVTPTTSLSTSTSATPYANHKTVHSNLIGSIEYLGSNVEQISMTPSPSPQVTPLKTTMCSLTTTGCDANQQSTNISPPSSSNTSETKLSSAIAKPILSGNGNTLFIHDKANKSPTASPTLVVSEESDILNATMLSNTMGDTVGDNSMSGCTAPTSMLTFSSSVISSNGSSTPRQDNAPLPKSLAIDKELLHWKDMPEYLQFNPYVLNGYRPLQTFTGCVTSLFYWHNESINILTHAIPIIYILAIVPSLMPWEKGYRFLSFCHVFGSVAPWCGSFVYHLFMNIERGEQFYYRLLKLDMVGIWVSQSFGALPLVVATTFCFSSVWKWLFIISYCLMSLWGLYKAITASSPWQRRLCFAMPFTMRSMLTCLRTLDLVGGNRVALSHVYLQDGVSILGGAIGAMRIPEKWFPGLVDYYLNSHNIMHVLVVVAVYSMHKATIKDFEWMSTTTCSSGNNATIELIANYLKSNVDL